nr:dynactin [Quercus suber]
MSLIVGQRIELNDGRIAIVRFVGSTHFQTGEWVGVELEDASGKNDGSVKGERYFDCEANHGMFLRPTGVRQIIEEPTPKPAKSVSNGVQAKSRPSSMHAAVNGVKRQSVVDGATKRMSVGMSSPTPSSRNAAARTPVKSPTKQLGGSGVTASATSRTNTLAASKKPALATATTRARGSQAPPTGTTSASRRTSTLSGSTATITPRASRSSLAPPAVSRPPAARQSIVPDRVSAREPPTRVSARQRLSGHSEETTDDSESQRSSAATPSDNASSAASQVESDADTTGEDDTVRPSFAPPPVPPIPPEPLQSSTRSRRPSSPTAASIHSQRTIRSGAASNRQIEELEAKVRLLERKRHEDRDIRTSMEQAQQERDQCKSIIEKLQNKYRPQQQEIVNLKQALSDSESRFGELEKLQAEHETVYELATLDREMAEARAEDLQVELDALRIRNEEAELELEILKEENGELSKEMSPEERTSSGWVQMEKSNERLREALLRLRDLTQDKEDELKEQIQGLEDQVKDVDRLKRTSDETKERLLQSEANVNDLRQQLEVAEESEEMIEELSEQKNVLEERIQQLRYTIEELENLRELNDELEINHVEAEKQMLEEIDFKDSLLVDRERTTKQQQEALDEADYTIVRYRTLVNELQGSLSEMQASKQLSETEAADLNNKSRAILDLNMKLQSSAAKTQVKTIDLELRKLDAQEASEHLAIVQLFLPETFQTERDSVLALLRFRRIGFKANVVHGFVKERIQSFGSRGIDEDVFAASEVIDKLAWIVAMSERFVKSISGCSIHEFTQYESALYELEPVERALNNYIDSIRQEELKAKDMAKELQRSIAVMSHLASIHIKDDLVSHADHLLMRTQCLQSQLESTASALTILQSLVETNVKSSGSEEEDEDNASLDVALIPNRAETLIAHARTAKVMAGKADRSLADLATRFLTLETSCIAYFDSAEAISTQVTEYTRHAGVALQELFGEEGRTEIFTPSEVTSVLSRVATAVFNLPAPEAGPLSALAGNLRSLSETLSDLASLPTDLDNTVEFERAPQPWVARADEIKQIKLTSLDTEAQLARARDSIREHDSVLKDKETELEEQSVRIEMLEARLKDAGKRSAKIAELERSLHEARDHERKSSADLVKARQDAERNVERVREEMARLAQDRGRHLGNGNELDDGAAGATVRLSLKRQEHKISSLESAVRYLQSETARLRLPSPDAPTAVRASMDWLHESLYPPPSRARIHNETIRAQGQALLQQMLQLAARQPAPLVDLTKIPENKLAWRPAKESSRWQVERRKEDWEEWKAWRKDILREGRRGLSSRPANLLAHISKGSLESVGETV